MNETTSNSTKPENVVVEMIPFTRKPAKPTIAREATPAETSAYATGFELGSEHAESQAAWKQALASCKSTEMRSALRAGFVAGYAPFCATAKAAQNRFDYLARMFAPAATSRKAKSNAKKAKAKAKGGRPEKTKATKAVMSEKTMARNITAALGYIAKMQEKFLGDDDVMPVLGKIAGLLSAK